MSFPKVSIITPTYNCADYIKDAIRSVFDQTYQNYELIVIDDGSTDNTGEVIKPYLCNDKLRYIRQENLGQAAARNRGLKKATGEYIAFLDADDIWEKSKLEKQLSVVKKSQADVCYTAAKIVDDETGEIVPYIRLSWLNRLRKGDILPYLIFSNFIPFSSIIVKHKCFEKLGTMDESINMGDDWDLLLRLSVFFKFDFVNEQLLVYRLHRPGSISSNIKRRIAEQEKIINKF